MRRPHRFLLALGLAFIASTSSRLRQGQRDDRHGARAAGARSDHAPAAAIGEVTHYNIFEGLTKINEDFSVTPLLAEKWDFSPDLKTLTFTLRRDVNFQDGETFTSKDVKFSFERFAGKESTNKDKGFFASIEFDRTPDPMTVVLKFKEPSFQALFHLGPKQPLSSTKRARRTRRPTRSAPDPTRSPPGPRARRSRSTKWDGFRDAAKIAAGARDVPLHFRSVGRGRCDARRRPRRLPALRQCSSARPVPKRSAFPGSDRRHRGQNDPRA